jgi:transcriptional regulator with XRE-family HTH domain
MPAGQPVKNRFDEALKFARKATGRTQEDFAALSSRTYISALERGLKTPTLSKVEDLAQVLGIHPLTLLVMTYSHTVGPEIDDALLKKVSGELKRLFEN